MLKAIRGRLDAVWHATVEAVRHPVIAVGLGLIVAQSVFLGWALFPSWFYGDDFALIGQGQVPLTWSYLMEPYSIHVMPTGRFIAWIVGQSTFLNWPLTAAITLSLVSLGSLSCLWMLTTLFGRRWGIIGPLALYLTSAVPTGATMWWAASVHQVPQHLAMFLAVGAWVKYLRNRSYLWLSLAFVSTSFGVVSYVKTALIVPVLAYVLFAFFTTGRPVERIRQALTKYWPSAVAFAVLGVGVLWFYSLQVDQLNDGGGNAQPARLFENMLIRSLGSGLLGGPWSWDSSGPPVSWADPPFWATHLAWMALVLGLAYLALTRVRTGRVWCLFAGYSLASYAILMSSRAPMVGAIAGLENRYLTDSVVMFALCLGLASMTLIGADEPTELRPKPILRVTVPTWTVVTAAVLVCGLGVMSSVRYVVVWHDDNPGRDYLAKVETALHNNPRDLMDTVLPEKVVSGYTAPFNKASVLLPLVTAGATFPDASNDIGLLDEFGNVTRPSLEGGATARPGPIANCGWRIPPDHTRSIPLTSRTPEGDWWIRIDYLAPEASPVTISADSHRVDAVIAPGLQSLHVRLPGEYSRIEIGGLDPEVSMCVDRIDVGVPQAGEPL